MTKDRFVWSIVGASAIAESSIVPAIRAQPGSSIASVVSSTQDRARVVAERCSAKVASLDQALADPSVDAVYISSINSRHFDQTMAAIAAGKHVMCEKPLALNVTEAKAMAEAAEKAGVLLATNHHMRNSKPHEIMRRSIANGDLGTVVGASVRHAVLLPESAQGWRTTSRESGAGVILDITVHDADALRFVLGADPVSAYARARSGTMTSDGIDESVMGTASFTNGVDVSFFESFVTGHARTELSIYGTEASMVGVGIQSMQPVGDLYRVVNGEQEVIDLGVREDLYTVGFRRFQAAARDKFELPAATAEDGIWSLAFADAALRSVHSGQVEAVEGPISVVSDASVEVARR